MGFLHIFITQKLVIFKTRNHLNYNTFREFLRHYPELLKKCQISEGKIFIHSNCRIKIIKFSFRNVEIGIIEFFVLLVQKLIC